jgi:alkylation response protein AidB-like acyl-CoA dehydrogenase
MTAGIRSEVEMDPQLSAEDSVLHAACRRFLDRQCPPVLIRQMEGAVAGYDPQWWRQAAEIGWVSALTGSGGAEPVAGLPSLAVIAEECGRHVAPGPLLSSNVVALVLAEEGSEVASEWLWSLASGDWSAAWCLTEDGHDALSDEFQMAASWRPDGTMRLTGRKRSVEGAGQAALLMVTAGSPGGIVHVVLPTGTPGIDIRPLQGVDLARRYFEVACDGVTVPSRSVVVDDPLGRRLRRCREVALTVQAAETGGALSRAFEMTLDNLAHRFSFGRPLASYQALKHEMANLKMELESCLGIATAAVHAVARGDEASAELTSAAKAYQGSVATTFVQRCIQLHGGIGVTWEHDLHLFLRRVMDNRPLFGGPAEHLERLAILTGAGTPTR